MQGLLGQFIDFIKERKTVALDDVAAEFGLRTQDVINRIQGLEAMGRLTGVMDDRGKVRPKPWVLYSLQHCKLGMWINIIDQHHESMLEVS